ncbi:acetyl-CoA carboxylase biotin carboxyl carrier protein [Halalkalibacter urbisdiaboli]|uniref:acetyl-CoA carboxylase biotin carboxyl carrier protein n=1 Tax=Halalkalibacter urbisdiaboli TaxID=1960589 RepID=UPI000B43C0E2|nr:acetyl-CoA carboxylase biotin carboxyl carrier protein [Halalkalibacter urbisdiaboli]
MLKVQEIKELIRAMDQSSLDEFKFEQDGTKLVLRKEKNEVQAIQVPTAPAVTEVQKQASVQQTPVQAVEETKAEQAQEQVQEQPSTANLHTITSPMVGTFYAAPSPDAEPYVKKGDEVNSESVVCIIEAMKLMNEIEAEVKGRIVEVLAENGELVEYGQPLFVVEPR